MFGFGRKKRTTPRASPDVVARELKRRGFHFIQLDRGWQADGTLGGDEISITLDSGYQANRFAKPWIFLVEVHGRPRTPWPMMPEVARVIETGDNSFIVALPELTQPGKHKLIFKRIGEVLQCRKPPGRP